MTVVCPSGHSSSTADYCDVCGAPIATAPSAGAGAPSAGAGAPPTAVLAAVEELDTSAAAVREPCVRCGTPRSGNDRYCENCGHDFEAPGQAWEAVATADREQFERVAVPGIEFPGDYPEQRFALDGPRVRIGRSRGRPGEPLPEINLAGQPEDPAISRLHAVLEREADGSWTLRDLGSTNGTTVNDDLEAIGTDTGVTLDSGDRIRVGAWTTITVRAL